MMPFKSLTLAAMAALMLGGCSTSQFLTSTEPQQTIYSLRPLAAHGENAPVSARILEVSAPSVPPGMERDRIALYLNEGQKLDYYAAAQWSAPLDYLVQDVTRRSAGAVLPYVVAVTPDQGIAADYRLQVKINEFQPVYTADPGAPPVVKANVEFTLLRLPEDKIISHFTLSKQEAVAHNKLDDIILKMELLLQEIEQDAFEKLDSKLRMR